MAVSSLVDKLSLLVKPDEEPFDKPFTMVVGKDKWTVATDRAWVVAVRGAGAFPLWDASEERIGRVQAILGTQPTKDAITVPAVDLLAWASSEDEDLRPGSLVGLVVDTYRVAQLLEGLPFNKVLVWDASAAVGMPCLGMVSGDRWKAFLAGLLTEVPTIEAFDPRGQRSTFDMLMGD